MEEKVIIFPENQCKLSYESCMKREQQETSLEKKSESIAWSSLHDISKNLCVMGW